MKNFILILFLIPVVFLFHGCFKSGPSVKELKEQIVKMEKENETLKSQVSEIEKEKEQLKIKADKFEKENKKLKAQTDKIRKENNQLKTSKDKIKKERDNAINELERLSGQDFNTQSIPSRSDELIDDVNNIKNDILNGNINNL